MNRFLEGCILFLITSLALIILFIALTFFIITTNNMDQKINCDRMQEYEYLTILEEEKFVLTCYVIMEDGIKIRSSDYVISDNRKPKMINKELVLMRHKDE